MNRYIIEPPWSVEQTGRAAVIESATLLDTRDGHRYQSGAYRVRLLCSVEGFKTRTFRGESAPYKAVSLFREIHSHPSTQGETS